MNGKRGYAPKSLLRELSSFYRDEDLTHIVPVSSSKEEKPSESGKSLEAGEKSPDQPNEDVPKKKIHIFSGEDFPSDDDLFNGEEVNDDTEEDYDDGDSVLMPSNEEGDTPEEVDSSGSIGQETPVVVSSAPSSVTTAVPPVKETNIPEDNVQPTPSYVVDGTTLYENEFIPPSSPPPSSVNNAEVPPLPSVNSEAPPLPSVNSEVPPLPSVNSEVPPLPSVNSEVPPLPSVNSEVSPLPSVNSKVPPLLSANSEVPPLPSVNSEVPPLPSVNSEVPPLPSENSKVPPLTSWSSEVPPLPSENIEVPPLPSENIEVPPLPSVSSDVPLSVNGKIPSPPSIHGDVVSSPNSNLDSLSHIDNVAGLPPSNDHQPTLEVVPTAGGPVVDDVPSRTSGADHVPSNDGSTLNSMPPQNAPNNADVQATAPPSEVHIGSDSSATSNISPTSVEKESESWLSTLSNTVGQIFSESDDGEQGVTEDSTPKNTFDDENIAPTEGFGPPKSDGVLDSTPTAESDVSLENRANEIARSNADHLPPVVVLDNDSKSNDLADTGAILGSESSSGNKDNEGVLSTPTEEALQNDGLFASWFGSGDAVPDSPKEQSLDSSSNSGVDPHSVVIESDSKAVDDVQQTGE